MQETLTFHEHIKELRTRFLYVIVSLGIAGAVCYVLRNPIIRFIQRPLHSALYYTSPAGSFNFIIKICTILGVFLALPVIVYNIVKFIEPALPKKLSGKTIMRVTGTSFVLAIMGGAFGYYVIVPMSLHFFMSYSSTTVRPLITTSEYLSFVLNVLITFALIFQIPLMVLFINFIKPLDPRGILRYQKYIVVASLVIAVLLPFTYDPISQFVLALPILGSFYISVFLIKIVNRKKKVIVSNVEPVLADELAMDQTAPEPIPLPVTPIVEEAPLPEPAFVQRPQLKPKRSIYIDGFANARPMNPMRGFKTFDVMPIDEYRSRNSIRTKGKNLSIDGFTFANT